MKSKIILLILGLIFIGISTRVWQIRDAVFQISFDFSNKNETVETRAEVLRILNTFDQIKVTDLEKEYLFYSKINAPQYVSMLRGTNFYLVPQPMIYKKIVGDTRIKDLISRDEFYKKALFDRNRMVAWLIDIDLLNKILKLRTELSNRNFNKDAFEITYGHRTPIHNEAVNGASKSRHIKGEAVDMIIGDINNDGTFSKEDKSIVLNILEKKIIKNKGGIGKYPGTRVVHMDVRDSRARWDSY